MKTPRIFRIGWLSILLLSLGISGCYTQLAVVEKEPVRVKKKKQVIVEEGDREVIVEEEEYYEDEYYPSVYYRYRYRPYYRYRYVGFWDDCLDPFYFDLLYCDPVWADIHIGFYWGYVPWWYRAYVYSPTYVYFYPPYAPWYVYTPGYARARSLRRFVPRYAVVGRPVPRVVRGHTGVRVRSSSRARGRGYDRGRGVVTRRASKQVVRKERAARQTTRETRARTVRKRAVVTRESTRGRTHTRSATRVRTRAKVDRTSGKRSKTTRVKRSSSRSQSKEVHSGKKRSSRSVRSSHSSRTRKRGAAVRSGGRSSVHVRSERSSRSKHSVRTTRKSSGGTVAWQTVRPQRSSKRTTSYAAKYSRRSSSQRVHKTSGAGYRSPGRSSSVRRKASRSAVSTVRASSGRTIRKVTSPKRSSSHRVGARTRKHISRKSARDIRR